VEILKIGIIGFGEVGYTFSKAMVANGAEVRVYDILFESPIHKKEFQYKILEIGCIPSGLSELCTESEYIVSTVVTQAALEVAAKCSPLLDQESVYIDLNSTSPSVKVKIREIIEANKGEFVEGAILGAVGASGAKTKILTSGIKGKEVANNLKEKGLNTEYYSKTIGQASMFKMLRSIFSKGVEILLLEMLVAGRRAGIAADLWTDITEFMNSKPFEEIASNWVQSHAVAHIRRYHEMIQVEETLNDLGLNPTMTSGTTKYFKQSIDLGVGEVFETKPNSVFEVIDFIEKLT
jgi:3-hydroxyisobutyrate dehydrogenase-like beta-hydroxyacid dehydrogenase